MFAAPPALPPPAPSHLHAPLTRTAEGFHESNLMHSINGRVYCNLGGLSGLRGDVVRFLLLGMGSQVRPLGSGGAPGTDRPRPPVCTAERQVAGGSKRAPSLAIPHAPPGPPVPQMDLHSVQFAGQALAGDFGLGSSVELVPAVARAVDVRLGAAGTSGVFCAVHDHYTAGMRAALTVA